MTLEDAVQQVNRILSQLKNKRYVVIWGAAEVAAGLYEFSDIKKYQVVDVVDRYKAGISFFGYVVKKPEDILWNLVDAVVVSALNSTEQIMNEIRQLYQYKGDILTVQLIGQSVPFYAHLSKYEIEVPDDAKDVIKKNKKFENIHEGKRIFIICNAPSINKLDLCKLQQETKMVVSNFYMHKDFEYINPDYYCFAQFAYNESLDDVFYAQWLKEISLHGNNIQYFFNITERRLIEEIKCFHKNYVNYMYLDTRVGRYYENVDMTKKMMMGQSVSVDCIQIAIYMGFHEIYLIGTEHAEIKEDRYDYFYDRGTSIIGDKDTSVSKDGQCTWSFQDRLQNTYVLWEQYKRLKGIADDKGIRIYNATPDGVLDVFDRIDYNELF